MDVKLGNEFMWASHFLLCLELVSGDAAEGMEGEQQVFRIDKADFLSYSVFQHWPKG